MLLTVLTTAALAWGPTPTPQDSIKWAIDVNHSEVSFRIRHFVTKVPGSFTKFGGVIVADPDKLSEGSVEVKIETASIYTKNDRRDTHLRSKDFFAADSFPEITFKSTKIEVKESKLTVTGNLTMRGVTKPVVLEGEYTGLSGKPEPREQRIGFSVTTKINRKDFGINWNRPTADNKMMLGDEVDVTINVEAVRQ